MEPVHLSPEPRGSLSNLIAVPVPGLEAPGADQVALAVKAVGLNFRDVLNVLGMYPGDPGPPGSDVAGMVTAASPGIPHLVGDLVFGLAAGCLGTAALGMHQTVVPVPPTVAPEAACTIPTVFLTADACFNAATLVRPGQRVLIHAATGGLGLAAVQVATAMGGVPLGTAGSTSKRTFLRSYWSGVHTALNSRNTDFATDLAQLCFDGVDVVLNSLTSPGMLAASLAVLRPGGAFIEVGKRNIWAAARMAQVCYCGSTCLCACLHKPTLHLPGAHPNTCIFVLPA